MKVIFRILTLLFAAYIGFQSLRAMSSVSSIVHADKVLHFVIYGALAFLARLGWPRLWGGWLFLACAGFGVVIEILQGGMDLGRTASLADALANMAGAALILVLFHFYGRRILEKFSLPLIK